MKVFLILSVVLSVVLLSSCKRSAHETAKVEPSSDAPVYSIDANINGKTQPLTK